MPVNFFFWPTQPVIFFWSTTNNASYLFWLITPVIFSGRRQQRQLPFLADNTSYFFWSTTPVIFFWPR
jgi:hypothetical protein